MSTHAQLKEILFNKNFEEFDAAVKTLNQQSLNSLATWLTDIERQRERTIDEHCRLGVVLVAQMKYYINDAALTNLAIDPLDKKFQRNTFQCTASFESINEIAYGFFQFQMCYDELIRLGITPSFAAITASILATGDFFSNITNFSPANDTNEWLFTLYAPLKNPWLRKFACFIHYVSIMGSYIPGSTPGCAAMLNYLPESMSQTNFALVASLMSVLTIFPGTAYFIGFRQGSMHKFFQSIEEYIEAPQKDWDILRCIETLKKVMAIVAYHALCFTFFTLYYLDAIRVKSPDLNHIRLFLASLTFFSTALNVIFSLIGPTLAEALNNDYSYVTKEEFQAAKSRYSWFTKESVVLTMMNGLIASGYGLILFDLAKNFQNVALKYLLAVGTTCVIMGISLYTQQQSAIYKDALARIDPDILNERKKHLDSDTLIPITEPLLEDLEKNDLDLSEEEHKVRCLHIVRANFAWLAYTFKSPTLVNTSNIFSILGRISRVLGFAYLLYKVEATFSLKFSSLMLLGLYLAFAPDPLKNEWFFFMAGTIKTVSQKMAEAFVFYTNTPKNISWLGSLLNALIIYNTPFVSYDLKIKVLPAMENRIAWLRESKSSPPWKESLSVCLRHCLPQSFWGSSGANRASIISDDSYAAISSIV